MASVFKIDQRFIKDLRTRLVALNKKHFPTRLQLPVPNAKHIEEIISSMIWASNQPEEGRLSRFNLTYSRRLPLDYLALEFRNPKRLGVEELRKLAPAVPPPHGHIRVWPGKDEQLYIDGVQTTGLASLTFEVINPGRITVSFGVTKIAEVTGETAGFIADEWSRRATQLMFNALPSTSVSSIDVIMSFFYSHAMNEILRRMRLVGHGGTIVIVGDHSKWTQSVDRPIFYEADQPLNEFQRIIKPLRDELEAEQRAIGKHKDSEQRILQKGLELINEARYQIFIGDAARSVAYLSQVDGATVLNQKFEVLAFGVKLKQRNRRTPVAKGEAVVNLLPFENEFDPTQKPLEEVFRGTRHLSGARFVRNNPDCLAFVVSQDGGITGFVIGSVDGNNPIDSLLAYRGLELLL